LPSIHQVIADPEGLLALEPEELALVLLQDLASKPSYGRPGPGIERGNVFVDSVIPLETTRCSTGIGLPKHLWRHGFGSNGRAFCFRHLISRIGIGWLSVPVAELSREHFEAYKYSSLFPRAQLHPAIAASTYALFVRGHYDTVVFEAFRAVEVAVRAASGSPPTLLGTDLMRNAFAVGSGPLCNPALVGSEQQAMSDLFAASIGLFKNPTSHRVATIKRPEEAVSLVFLADHLLRLVDERAPATGKP
jgi:uncharacterized protein (TIGR02391 family)